ncbi:hypothetical protein THAOC_32229, partial [Thalassiosira oceanica]
MTGPTPTQGVPKNLDVVNLTLPSKSIDLENLVACFFTDATTELRMADTFDSVDNPVDSKSLLPGGRGWTPTARASSASPTDASVKPSSASSRPRTAKRMDSRRQLRRGACPQRRRRARWPRPRSRTTRQGPRRYSSGSRASGSLGTSGSPCRSGYGPTGLIGDWDVSGLKDFQHLFRDGENVTPHYYTTIPGGESFNEPINWDT